MTSYEQSTQGSPALYGSGFLNCAYEAPMGFSRPCFAFCKRGSGSQTRANLSTMVRILPRLKPCEPMYASRLKRRVCPGFSTAQKPALSSRFLLS